MFDKLQILTERENNRHIYITREAKKQRNRYQKIHGNFQKAKCRDTCINRKAEITREAKCRESEINRDAEIVRETKKQIKIDQQMCKDYQNGSEGEKQRSVARQRNKEQ